jgi:hypothetical protein
VKAALVALALLGCATAPPPRGCEASRAAGLVGRARSDALGTAAVRLSGAERLRWIRPGDVVTMDFSPERLNLYLNAQNRIERITCG